MWMDLLLPRWSINPTIHTLTITGYISTSFTFAQKVAVTQLKGQKNTLNLAGDLNNLEIQIRHNPNSIQPHPPLLCSRLS
jgi:hypothetical protein